MKTLVARCGLYLALRRTCRVLQDITGIKPVKHDELQFLEKSLNIQSKHVWNIFNIYSRKNTRETVFSRSI